MHQGVVDVILPGGEEPGEVGVQAFVMVQRARPEIPEACQHPGQQDQRVEARFQAESDGRRDLLRCHRRLRGLVGVAVVAHHQRPAAVAVSRDIARRERGLIVTPGISIVPRHSLGRRYRLSHAGVPRLTNAPRGPAGRSGSIRRTRNEAPVTRCRSPCPPGVASPELLSRGHGQSCNRFGVARNRTESRSISLQSSDAASGSYGSLVAYRYNHVVQIHAVPLWAPSRCAARGSDTGMRAAGDGARERPPT